MIIGTMDFETANTAGIDLKDVGSDAYAAHPATEVLCLHIRFKGAVTGDFLWAPGMIGGEDDALRAYANNPDIIFEAHSAAFEQSVWKHIMVKRHGFPELPIQRFRCTMAQALYRGLPGALDKAAESLDLEERKDKETSKIVYALGNPMTKKRWLELCPANQAKATWAKQYKPVPDRSWETMEKCFDYCKQDCVVEEELSEITGPLSDKELEIWFLDQEINQRGVLLDIEFIRAAQRIVAEVHNEITGEFTQLTTCELFPKGLVPTQVAKQKEWLGKEHGIWVKSLDKAQMHAWGIGELEDVDALPRTDLPPVVRRVLEIRSILGSNSVKKFATMLASVGPGDRARNLLQYHGANTGRWAARGWQPHNLPRGLLQIWNGEKLAPPPHDELYSLIMMGKGAVEAAYGPRNVLKAVASSHRFAYIAPPGKALFWADFSGIEMRTIISMSGSPRAQELARGEDVYSGMAVQIFGLQIRHGAPMDEVKNTKWYAKWYGVNTEQRQYGKNTVLGCGFGMGYKTFHKRYCKDQPVEFAEGVIHAYRKEWAPEVEKVWWGLEVAALEAVKTEGVAEAYGVTYRWVQEGERAWLACELPDGQIQWYFNPVFEEKGGKFGGDAWSFLVRGKQDRRHGRQGRGGFGAGVICQNVDPEDETQIRPDGRMDAYGGLLTENVVQKLARGMLCEAMLRLRAAGFDLIMHVHDEALSEGHASRTWEEYRDIMIAPSTASRIYGIPIAVEGEKSTRYRK